MFILHTGVNITWAKTGKFQYSKNQCIQRNEEINKIWSLINKQLPGIKRVTNANKDKFITIISKRSKCFTAVDITKIVQNYR